MSATSQPESGQFRQIASWRHFAVVVAIVLAVAVRGFLAQSSRNPTANVNHTILYVSLIAMEGALIFLVWRGIRATGTTLRDLIGGRWKSARDVLGDLAIAIALWLALIGIAAAWQLLSGDREVPGLVSAILPRAPAEIVLWIAVSITAGAAEEIVFRGYCQRQLEALTGNAWIAMLLQAILFGVSHGYKGVAAMLRITVLGLAFGLVAVTRRSLRPGILAHAWTDIASGVLRSG